MSGENFFVTLPSNVISSDLFPENLVCNYRTKLPQTIRLSNEWEVAMTEISYTYSWFNIPSSYKIALIKIVQVDAADTKHESVETQELISNDMFIKMGNYNSAVHIVKRINECIKSYKPQFTKDDKLPKLSFDETTRKLTLNQGETESGLPIIVNFNRFLWGMLGFDYISSQKQIKFLITAGKTILVNKMNEKLTGKLLFNPEQATSSVDLKGGLHSLYVYTDIVKASFVGNSLSPLLRVVEIPSNASFGDQICIKYSNPYYLPIQITEFETIEIVVKDDTGYNIPFQHGRTIVTLNFRRK